ncbi:MAG: MFS transporter [Methylomonas sp.]|jgi:PPP family 3-phenylpropionic acid transporter
MTLPYWRLSCFYALYFAILGAILPFWSLYLKQTGFNATEIGELTALLVATKIIAPNIWGRLADKSGKRLRLIRYSTFFTALLFAGFAYRRDYAWFAAVTLSFSFFWNATLPQFEAATLTHLLQAPHRYGRIRLWGSVGFIAAVLGIGRFLDYFSIDYLPLIILCLMALNWLLALATPETAAENRAAGPTNSRHSPYAAEAPVFFAVYMLLQISHGPYYVFYSVYLQQHGYSATVTGFLWALGVGAEILLFIFAAGLLKRFSLRGLLLSSLALTQLRWLLIAYQVDEPAAVIGAQLLHAASFGVTHVVAMQLLTRYFGARRQGRGQALYASISFGLGGMIGSLYSGYYWDVLGATQIYVLAALTSGLALLIAFIGIGRVKPASPYAAARK